MHKYLQDQSLTGLKYIFCTIDFGGKKDIAMVIMYYY